MSISNQPKRNLFSDPSLWFLLLSNFVTVFFAIKENWDLSTIMWIYWFQSLIIGFFNFIRILQLKEFSTEGYEINGQSAQPTKGTKIFTAFFFLFHYGFFHIGYLAFLFIGSFSKFSPPSVNFIELKYIFPAVLIFFVNHLFSYFYNRPRDTKKPNIGALMFYPYARIIPMHFTIFLSSSFLGALPVFLILKTFSDAVMHIVEHKFIR